MQEDNTLPPPPRRERTASIEGTRRVLDMFDRNSEQGSERPQEPTRMQRITRESLFLLIPVLSLAGIYFYFMWVRTFFKDLFPHEMPECSADPVRYNIPRIWYDDEVHTINPVTHASLRHEGMTQADFMYQISLFSAVPAVVLAVFSYIACRFGAVHASNQGAVTREMSTPRTPGFLPPPTTLEGNSFRGSSVSSPIRVNRGDGKEDLLTITPTKIVGSSRTGGSQI